MLHRPINERRRLPLVLVALLCGLAVSFASRPAVRAEPAPSAAEFRQAIIDQQPIDIQPGPTLTPALVAPADLIDGEAAVTFASSVSRAEAESRIRAARGMVVDTVPKLNVYEVQLPDGMSVADGIVVLGGLNGVVRAEPLVQLHADLHPNDPLYTDYQAVYLQQIHAEQAWNVQLGDPSVVVAVLDSGVDLTHPDLRGQIWTNPNPGHAGCGNDIHGCNFVGASRVSTTCGNRDPAPAPNPDVQAYPRGDLNYHGTFVSGVIAAGINNGVGVTGIAPRVSLMPVRVGDCTKPFDIAIANGILYAADNGAAIINLSIGGTCKPWPSFMLDAIAHAEQRGVVVVAASGNDGLSCVDSPANATGVLAVGAVAADGQSRADFSNWGPQITVVAPGVQIVSTVPVRSLRPPNDLYLIDDGTSYAAPMVSGLAALLLSQNPLLTPELVRTAIQRGATRLDDTAEPGWAGAGRIDLFNSLQLVPGAFYGRVSRLGSDVPDGSSVEARIGGLVCGQATTFTYSSHSSYVVFVSTATERAGCGTPGATVAIFVNSFAAGTMQFKASAVPLDLPVATPAPVTAGTSPLFHIGWNLVAAPTGDTLPGSRGQLYTLPPGADAYAVLPAGSPLQSGVGYWAYFPADTSVPLSGDGSPSISVTLPADRYVMIGNPSGSGPVTVTGADIVYKYDSRRGLYVPTTTLQPGEGAWAFSAVGGTVTLR